ncbi:hypothetical protein LUW74_28895 [Actinomadura madurae]|uniref:hypothetical protein n=1 Tax=Actinomadura madurae TaxID=1993 RepID=UPI00202735C3|nr:hypothetical protein [Actinomadura madurae]URN06941.1 hypothetical protein LUW74_28895 [Actinomadura madurae]
MIQNPLLRRPSPSRKSRTSACERCEVDWSASTTCFPRLVRFAVRGAREVSAFADSTTQKSAASRVSKVLSSAAAILPSAPGRVGAASGDDAAGAVPSAATSASTPITPANRRAVLPMGPVDVPDLVSDNLMTGPSRRSSARSGRSSGC